jgi:hypothetical protein
MRSLVVSLMIAGVAAPVWAQETEGKTGAVRGASSAAPKEKPAPKRKAERSATRTKSGKKKGKHVDDEEAVSIFGRDDSVGNLHGVGLIGTEIGEAFGPGGLTGDGGVGGGEGIGTINGKALGLPRARASDTVAGEPATTGSLNKTLILGVVRRHLGEIRFCYEKQLHDVPTLAGKVAVTFTIGPEGAVADSQIASSTLANDAVEGCPLQRVNQWLFPQSGGAVKVTYPFDFRQAE